MSTRIETLQAALLAAFPADAGFVLSLERQELTLELPLSTWLPSLKTLRDDAAFGFSQLIDLCGLDYQDYAASRANDQRFAVVLHLLSVANNQRLRVRVYADDDSFPTVPSIVNVWPAANWFEREAFDLYGIMFDGHPDLRRILTDYGFVGHPFRKDFPVSGYMEMRYDAEQGRVIYQPVSIAPREVTPRIVREASYGDVEHG